MHFKNATIPIIILLLTITATAWTPDTKKHICEQAVEQLWGAQVLEECLERDDHTLQGEFCDLLTRYKENDYGCMERINRSYIHPASFPDIIFKDTEQYNYNECPIQDKREGGWICQSDGNTAGMKSWLWLQRATEAEEKCLQVRSFCIASAYYAESRDKLSQVEHMIGCMRPIEEEVESKVTGTDEEWEVVSYCFFKYLQPRAGQKKTVRHRQAFRYTERDIQAIVSNMTYLGGYIELKTNKQQKQEIVVETPAETTTTTVMTVTTRDPQRVVAPPRVDEIIDMLNRSSIEFMDKLDSLFKGLLEVGSGEQEIREEYKPNTAMMYFAGLIGIMGIIIVLYVSLKSGLLYNGQELREKPQFEEKEQSMKAPVGKKVPEFQDVEFDVELTTIPGVGASKAQILKEAGYHKLHHLVDVTRDELLLVKGLGEKTVDRILEHVKKKKK